MRSLIAKAIATTTILNSAVRAISRSPILVASVLFVIAAIAPGSSAQDRQSKTQTGTISGRVTVGDAPARNVCVLLTSSEQPSMTRPVARASSNQDGRFQMAGVTAGQYFLQAFAPALVLSADRLLGRQGKMINLSDGESVEAGDIALITGAVITGRVTDANGEPIIQENVRLLAVTADGRKDQVYLGNNSMLSTDDRGVYRLYGVPPGRYIVCAGLDPNSRVIGGNSNYSLVFYPDATEESKAKVIEASSGSELTGIDLVLGRGVKGHSVSGRIVDSLTGKPVVGMSYGYAEVDTRNGGFSVRSFTSSTSNSRGEFRLDSVPPGSYAAFASPTPESEMYSDAAPFTVTDSDVAGLVVKLSAGSSIAGNVIIEGGEGKAGVPAFSEFRLIASSRSLNVAPRTAWVNLAPDGSFRVSGLPRGMATFNVAYPLPKGISLLRVERDGVVQESGIEVGSYEEISGVKVVFGYGTGTIRGQVKVDDADPPENAMMFLNIERVGNDATQSHRSARVDLRGRFLIDGLQSGQYELSLFYQSRLPAPPANGPQIISKTVKQTVTVNNGQESSITMLITLNDRDR